MENSNLSKAIDLLKQKDLFLKYANEDIPMLRSGVSPDNNASTSVAVNEFNCQKSNNLPCIEMNLRYYAYHYKSYDIYATNHFKPNKNIFIKYFLEYINIHKEQIFREMAKLMSKDIATLKDEVLNDISELEKELKSEN